MRPQDHEHRSLPRRPSALLAILLLFAQFLTALSSQAPAAAQDAAATGFTQLGAHPQMTNAREA
ncbi:MAG: hypothetical protein QM692_15540, partial [Thermomicrobiales bacterium]